LRAWLDALVVAGDFALLLAGLGDDDGMPARAAFTQTDPPGLFVITPGA
jgi:hypothetical protein